MVGSRRNERPAVLIAAALLNAVRLSRWSGRTSCPDTALIASPLLVAGALSIAAFALFELIYGPMLLTRPTQS